MTKAKPHYAWYILVACCMVQGASLGIVQNCKGIFYEPVCSALGFNLGEFTFHQIFYAIGSIIMAPFVGWFYRRFPIRVLLTTVLTINCITAALMGFSSELWHWHVTGFVQGVTSIFLNFMLQPYLLGNWFEKRRGLVLGIAATMSGIMGSIMNVVIANVIELWGWQVGYFVVAGSAFALAFPATAFLIRREPADMGLLPYGISHISEMEIVEPQAAKANAKIQRKDLVGFACIFAIATLCGFVASFTQHLSNYAITIGKSLVVGATMVSAAMVGNIGGKVVIGSLSDKFGVKAASYSGIALVVLAFVLLTFFHSSIVLLYIGALLTGVSMSVNVVQMPLMGGYVYGKAKYTAVLSYISIALTLGGALGITAIGSWFDYFGSYTPTFRIGLIMAAVCAVLVPVLFAQKRRVNPAE